MEYLMIVMIVAVGIIAILAQVKPLPILWVAVLLLDIMFAVAIYGGALRRGG